MNDAPGLPLHDRLAGLAAFLPVFQAPGFEFGQWGGSEKTASGVIQFPYFMPSEQAMAFEKAAYDFGWVLPDFDWPNWQNTSEAIKLRDYRDSLDDASPDQLARLLTVLIRQDRYSEGALAAAFKSDLLTAIVARADALARES